MNELLSLVKQLEGFPTNSEEDVYGLDTRLVLTTFEIQWDNGGEVEGEGEIDGTLVRRAWAGDMHGVEREDGSRQWIKA